MSASSTHIPMLFKIMERTRFGPVLEMGIGVFSTPILHYLCMEKERQLVSYDNNISWLQKFQSFDNHFHKVNFVNDWDEADIVKPWTMALIDHAPGERRKVDIAKIAQHSDYIICHDSEEKMNHLYGYNEIYPLFKYRWEYRDLHPPTVVLSNFYTLEWLYK